MRSDKISYSVGRNSTGVLPIGTISPATDGAGLDASASHPPSIAPSVDQRRTGNSLIIRTPEGGVAVRNFYNQPKEVSFDHASVLIQETDAYTFSYYEPDHSFSILITKMPFDVNRAQAEAMFLRVLGISETDACKLSVRVGTQIRVDPEHSGQNLRLAFCAPVGQAEAQFHSDEQFAGQLLQQAQTLFEDNQYSKALERCNSLLEKYPTNSQAIELRNKIQQIIAILDQSPQQLQTPVEILQQAQTLFEEGQYSTALARCNNLLARDPGDLKAIELKNRIEKAIEILKQ